MAFLLQTLVANFFTIQKSVIDLKSLIKMEMIIEYLKTNIQTKTTKFIELLKFKRFFLIFYLFFKKISINQQSQPVIE
jgi:hypothetical protein